MKFCTKEKFKEGLIFHLLICYSHVSQNTTAHKFIVATALCVLAHTNVRWCIPDCTSNFWTYVPAREYKVIL